MSPRKKQSAPRSKQHAQRPPESASTKRQQGAVEVGDLRDLERVESRRIQLHRELFIGPLPHPDLLRKYEEALPGLAERIVAESEKEAEHRRATERGLLRLAFMGPLIGGAIVVVTVAGAIWLLSEGHQVGGLAALIAAVATLIAAYLGHGGENPIDTTRKDEGKRSDADDRG